MNAKTILDELDRRLEGLRLDGPASTWRTQQAGALAGLRQWLVDLDRLEGGGSVWTCSGCGAVHTEAITECACGTVLTETQAAFDARMSGSQRLEGALMAAVDKVGRKVIDCEICGPVVEAPGFHNGICGPCWDEHDRMVAEEEAERLAQIERDGPFQTHRLTHSGSTPGCQWCDWTAGYADGRADLAPAASATRAFLTGHAAGSRAAAAERGRDDCAPVGSVPEWVRWAQSEG